MDDYKAAQYIFERQSVSTIPYGLLSICSYVRRNSSNRVEMEIFDLNHEIYKAYRDHCADTKHSVYDALKREIERFCPDIVGISVMFNISYMYLEPVAAIVKRINSNIILIVGGNLATSLYAETLSDPHVDAVCYGEGEMPFCRLVDAEDVCQELIASPAMFTKKKMQAGLLPVNEMIQDLDTLPPIDFDFIDLSCFKGSMIRFFQSDENKGELKTLVIYTTRGCPYNCCFCAGHVVHGKKVRLMSVEKVLSDVRLMVEHHNIKCLMINDDNFLHQKARAKEIFRGLAALELQVVFPSLLIRNIDDEIAALLKQVGVKNQLVSIESGSEYVLKNIIHKPLTKAQIFTAVENMRRYGISVDTNVVIGFPGETDEHRQETLKTIRDVGFNWSHFLIALPVPGTSLYRECREKKYLVNSDNFYSPNLAKCNISTPEYTPEHIQWQAYMMNLHANFVNNYNLRIGQYNTCMLHFNSILKSVPDHAFAYYGLMKAHEGKGEREKATACRNKFEEIVHRDSFWKNYADYFQLDT